MLKLAEAFGVGDSASDGVWVEYPGSGARVKIRHLTYKPFDAYFSDAMEPYQSAGVEIDSEAKRQIMAQGVARHIVVDLENVQDSDGEMLSASDPEKLAKAFLKYPSFLSFIVGRAQRHALFQDKADAEAEGN